MYQGDNKKKSDRLHTHTHTHLFGWCLYQFGPKLFTKYIV